VLLPVSLVTAFAGSCLGPVMVILALGKTKASFWLTVIEAVLVPSFMIIGAEIDDARGAAWGLCLQYAILLPLWFLQLRRVLAEMDAEAAEAENLVPSEAP
jgi:hypothetical protein